MASKLLKREVLSVFKKLHKTRRKVFDEDDRALAAARAKINHEFRKNIAVADEATINELIHFAKEVDHEMRTTIIQAKEVSPGVYEAKVTEDTILLDNTEFDIAKCPDNPKPPKKSACGNSQNTKS